MSNVLEIYKAHYKEYYSHVNDDPTKYEWAADNVFDLTTYDGELDELFVNTIIEVCAVILNGKSFEYITDRENYIKYILVCQLLDKFRWIDWGTSIRGAWFAEQYFKVFGSSRVIKSKVILSEYQWSQSDPVTGTWEDHAIEEVPFTIENIAALIEFITDDSENGE